jgi:chloramphenicol 3-O-phosphotransferase
MSDDEKTEKKRFGFDDEQIRQIMRLQQIFKDSYLLVSVSDFLKDCENEQLQPVLAYTAITAELLTCAAHIHLESSGATDAFCDMARRAVDAAIDAAENETTEH